MNQGKDVSQRQEEFFMVLYCRMQAGKNKSKVHISGIKRKAIRLL